MAKYGQEFQWFADLMADAIRDAGGQATLARRMKVSESSISDYKKLDSLPGLENFAILVEFMKGKLSRALPTYEPPAFAAAKEELSKEFANRIERIRDVGLVAGGKTALKDQANYQLMDFDDLWRDSPWWGYTNNELPVVTMTVRGDSMAPTYPDGCRLALRSPSMSPENIPSGAPCVLREGHGTDDEEYTFKLWGKIEKKEKKIVLSTTYIGWPINPEHDPVIFKRPHIEFIALGIMKPTPHGVPPEVKRRKAPI